MKGGEFMPKKMSEKREDKVDRKLGIKEGSARDLKRDKRK